MMRNSVSPLFLLLVAAAIGAQSCAMRGPARVAGPCDDDFDSLLHSARTENGLEIVGRLRLETERYRLRGLLRVVYSPGRHEARLDFRHSSLFGAIEEDVTLLAGDSLIIYDRESGRSFGNDSALALIEREVGQGITPADILAVLLLAPPRCAEMRSSAVEYRGDEYELRAAWRDRGIDIRGRRGVGVEELRFCLAGDRDCYIAAYGRWPEASPLRYPGRVKLSRAGGGEMAIFELIDIKEVSISASLFETGALEWGEPER